MYARTCIPKFPQKDCTLPIDFGRFQSRRHASASRATTGTGMKGARCDLNATGPAPRIDQVPTYSTFERASYTGPYNLTGSPALSVPIGFVCDHLEVLYDIDHEAADKATALGMTLRRTRMPNATPELIAVLDRLVAGVDHAAPVRPAALA